MPKRPPRALVYGSRHWYDPIAVRDRLKNLDAGYEIVTGMAKGADSFADKAAYQLGRDRIQFPYNGYRGSAGGNHRNARMASILDAQMGDIAICFRADGHSPGTDNMTKLLKVKGIPIEFIEESKLLGRWERLAGVEPS